MSFRRAGNVPFELTSFIGRRRETAEVKKLVELSRLVTLTGVGGAGKTRLSVQVAGELWRAFPDGVWFVELAALDDHELLAQTVASTLGVHDRTARWTAPALAEYLGDKQLLLVLDNCEHLRDACAVLADQILRAAPSLRILATSRQALGLTGEHTLQVPPMSLPEPGEIPPLDALGQYEAVSLFVDRAVSVQPAFALTADNYQGVVRICQRLDGIPLAIELTAVRLTALSVEEILERLEDRYRLLSSGSPGALPRHQTLRALIDWSSELCSAPEQELWNRLSVFSADFDLPAAEAICSGGDITREDVVDLVTALVDKSIVVAEEKSGRMRFRMLDTIRQYGRDRLREQGTEPVFRQRHRDYFCELVDQAWSQWLGPGQEESLRRLLREHGNLRTALEFSFSATEHAAAGLRLAGGLWFFWLATGLTSEGRRWLERGLKLDQEPGSARTRALWVCGYLCVLQEDIAAAESRIARCHDDAKQLGDGIQDAWAIQLDGMVAMSRGDVAAARRLLADAQQAHRVGKDVLGVLDSFFYLVAATAMLGELHQAAALCEEALALCDAHGERWLKSYMLWDLGLVCWQLGDSTRASAAGHEGLRMARGFNEQWVIAFCIEILAWTANAELQHRRAARLLGGAAGIWQRIGAPLFGMRPLTRPHDQCIDQVRERLGERAFDADFRRGRQLSIEEATCFALDERQAPQQAPTADGNGQSLTPRECEVADLIARGLSNKEIAAALVISKRTAEAHVEHILAKLAFNSRAQIAAWVAEHRPPTTAATDRR